MELKKKIKQLEKVFIPSLNFNDPKLQAEFRERADKGYKDFCDCIKKGDYEGAERIANNHQDYYKYVIIKSDSSNYKYKAAWYKNGNSFDKKNFSYRTNGFLKDLTRDFNRKEYYSECGMKIGALCGAVLGGVYRWRDTKAKNRDLLNNSTEYQDALQNFYTEKAQALNDKNYIDGYTFTPDDLLGQVKEWYEKSYQDIIVRQNKHQTHQIIVDPRYSDYYFDYSNTDGFGIADGVSQITNDFIDQFGYALTVGSMAGSMLMGCVSAALITYMPMIALRCQTNKIKREYVEEKSQELFNSMVTSYIITSKRESLFSDDGFYHVKE